jgi:hypothetical protein
MTAATTTTDRTDAKVAEAAAYGVTLGRNAADTVRGVGAADALKVLTLARRGELAEVLGVADIGERVTARSLARDLGVRPGTRLAAAMHEAMVGAWGPAFYAEAIDLAQRVIGGDLYA